MLDSATSQIEELKKCEGVEYMQELEERVKEAERERVDKERLMRHLEEALKPMILRLKVMDLQAISEEEMEVVPLRFLLSELKRLVQAYEDVEKGLPVPQYQHQLYGQSATTVANVGSVGGYWSTGSNCTV
jgi:glutamine synthetase adenylyltransferase